MGSEVRGNRKASIQDATGGHRRWLGPAAVRQGAAAVVIEERTGEEASKAMRLGRIHTQERSRPGWSEQQKPEQKDGGDRAGKPKATFP